MPAPEPHSPAVAQPDAGEANVERAYAQSQVSPWTFREKVGRALWIIVRGSLFRFSWHNWYGWRRFLLRCFGARIGTSVNVRPTTRIEIPWLLSVGDYCSLGDYAVVYNLGQITLGRRVTVSQYAQLCAGTHDYTKPELPLLRPPISIDDNAWIAACAFVGPGVRVGQGAILGACGVAFKNLAPWTIYAGNPAHAVKERTPLPGTEPRSAGL
ncbi:MAG: putative colanic acid biosynthesis acetyltransferase [Phycisphaerales bacterium]